MLRTGELDEEVMGHDDVIPMMREAKWCMEEKMPNGALEEKGKARSADRPVRTNWTYRCLTHFEQTDPP